MCGQGGKRRLVLPVEVTALARLVRARDRDVLRATAANHRAWFGMPRWRAVASSAWTDSRSSSRRATARSRSRAGARAAPGDRWCGVVGVGIDVVLVARRGPCARGAAGRPRLRMGMAATLDGARPRAASGEQPRIRSLLPRPVPARLALRELASRPAGRAAPGGRRAERHGRPRVGELCRGLRASTAWAWSPTGDARDRTRPDGRRLPRPRRLAARSVLNATGEGEPLYRAVGFQSLGLGHLVVHPGPRPTPRQTALAEAIGFGNSTGSRRCGPRP